MRKATTRPAATPEPRPPEPGHFVAIGASAGGLEAIEAFFTHMPAQSGLAFIVIQHLSPDYKSLMVELLSKRTAMPVQRAEDGMLMAIGVLALVPSLALFGWIQRYLTTGLSAGAVNTAPFGGLTMATVGGLLGNESSSRI